MYFFRRCFLLNNKPINYLCKISYHHCTLCVHSPPCLQYSSFPGSVYVPFHQLELVKRSVLSALDLLSGNVKLTIQFWIQVWMLWTPELPILVSQGILSHGTRDPWSVSMPRSTSSSRAPELTRNYKLAPVVTECRAAAGGLTANFDTVISVKVTSGPLSFCQLTESCVASCGQYRSHLSVLVSLLKQGNKQIRIKKDVLLSRVRLP